MTEPTPEETQAAEETQQDVTADPPLGPDDGRVRAEEDDGSEALEHGGGGNG